MEPDYIEKPPLTNKKHRKITEIPHSKQHFDAVKEVTEISHGKLTPMLEKSAFMFHHNIYPKPKK